MTMTDFRRGQFPDDEDRDGFETSACLPFNHLPRLLDQEYFIEWGFGFLTYISVSGVTGFDQVFTVRYDLGIYLKQFTLRV
jgi:hypothetical protein